MASESSLAHLQSPATFHTLSQINAVEASPSHFLNVNFNIILPTTPRYSKGLKPRSLEGYSTTPHIRYDTIFWLMLLQSLYLGML